MYQENLLSQLSPSIYSDLILHSERIKTKGTERKLLKKLLKAKRSVLSVMAMAISKQTVLTGES